MAPPPQLPSKTSMVSSSPGRAEKLPTPGLARLLRGKSGSRSRGQTSLSRSSPLFPSRNRTRGRAAPSIDAANHGEPSSPKVTCIGQVRIRKKNDPTINRTQSEQKKRGESKMHCCFISKSLFSSFFRSRQSAWRRWMASARLRLKGNAGYRRGNERVEPAEAAPLGELDCHKFEETRLFVPPKNALLLMRCRSAPHNRSSALATRSEEEAGKETESEKSCEEEEGEEEEETRCASSRPLFLKRCNSEPAKAAARLVAPEAARCSQNGDDGNRRSANIPSQLH